MFSNGNTAIEGPSGFGRFAPTFQVSSVRVLPQFGDSTPRLGSCDAIDKGLSSDGRELYLAAWQAAGLAERPRQLRDRGAQPRAVRAHRLWFRSMSRWVGSSRRSRRRLARRRHWDGHEPLPEHYL